MQAGQILGTRSLPLSAINYLMAPLARGLNVPVGTHDYGQYAAQSMYKWLAIVVRGLV